MRLDVTGTGRVDAGCTIIGVQTFTLLNDKESRRLGMDDREFDASEAPADAQNAAREPRALG